VRTRVKELGLANHIASSAKEVVAEADLVILSIPLGAYASALKEIAPALKPGAIVSDTGSVKASAVQA